MSSKFHERSLRIPPEMLAEAEEIARTEDRPVANVLRLLVKLGLNTFRELGPHRGEGGHQ